MEMLPLTKKEEIMHETKIVSHMQKKVRCRINEDKNYLSPQSLSLRSQHIVSET